MPLQAYIDGSGNAADDPALVLAGYIATVDQWEKFSDEWQRILDVPLRLEYFKMNEAVKLRDQFRGWSEERRDQRLNYLHSIIEKHIQAFVCCVLPYEDFYNVFPKKGKLHPYHIAFLGLMSQLGANKERLGLYEEIDFIFDEEEMEKSLIYKYWDWIRENSPPEASAFIGRNPIFRDDEKFLPLQAADQIAWLCRNYWESARLGTPAYEPPWKSESEHQGIIFHYDKRSLGEIVDWAVRSAPRDND